MSKAEILQKAIEKAVKNGYKSFYSVVLTTFPASDLLIKNDEHLKFIYSHDFAKHFWGEDTYKKDGLTYQWWTHHLQQMVLETDPMRYLEKFI